MESVTTLLPFILIAVLFLFLARINSAKAKGARGERTVARRLKNLNKKEYIVFNDIHLIAENDTTQIDHLIISIYGIFVIETKHYKGWIHGHENSEFWTQSIYSSKRKFRNPIKQNWAHIYFLKRILPDFRYTEFHPIIVFTGEARLKNVTSFVPVIYKHRVLPVIKQKEKVCLSMEDIQAIANKVRWFIREEKVIKTHHRKTVKRNIQQRKNNVKAGICPNCKSKLVLRKGRYGKFYGCTNYPHCKFTSKY